MTLLGLGEREARKNSKLLRSASAVGVMATRSNDRAAQVKAGRAFERLWLRATSEGVAVHPMNQILQVPDLKEELAGRLGADGRSLQLLFRLGYAEAEGMRRPRRPVEAVLQE